MKLARAAVGLAITAGTISIAAPAHADDPVNTAPTANYALDSAAIWAGQRVTLAESGRSDDTTPPAAITRAVSWGDGITDGNLTHAYASAGSYQITVTLNDGAENGAGVFAAGSTVTVTTSPGSYGWQKSPVYTFPGYQEQGTMVASGLPTSTRVWTSWTDGETSLLASNSSTSVNHWYRTGTWTPQITLQNGQGKATPRAAGSLSVLDDVTRPTATLTTPAGPSKASSWATLHGKAYDSESGVDVVGVQVYKWAGTTDYYYNFASRSWVKYTSTTVLPEGARALRPTDAGGNWSTPVAGLTKGWTIEVIWYAWDKVGNLSDDHYVVYALTAA
jgi:hypothetical protein